MNFKPLTPEQVKERFRARGMTITEWAEKNGFQRRSVYLVLNGQAKANYGRAYEIAVALGLKQQATTSAHNCDMAA